MEPLLSSATILTGLLLGWSVAWPPGPVNAEIMRRAVVPLERGGGFWFSYKVALGAALGDFLWALGVAMGAGAVINTPAIRVSLSIVSFALLLFLAAIFARNAWRIAKEHRAQNRGFADGDGTRKRDRGFLLGFLFVLTSPWGLGFWLAVIGSQSATVAGGTFTNSLVVAVSVVVGALAWATFLCVGVKLGAHIFSRPGWQIATQALTAVLMLYFAVRLAVQLSG